MDQPRDPLISPHAVQKKKNAQVLYVIVVFKKLQRIIKLFLEFISKINLSNVYIIHRSFMSQKFNLLDTVAWFPQQGWKDIGYH